MKKKLFQYALLSGALLIAFIAGTIIADQSEADLTSQVVSEEKAAKDVADWGTFYAYYTGQTFGTKDALNGVAVIKPGQEIHPPHRHAEEEFLMVIEGEGEWHVNGKDFPAKKGDILYAAPWDIHGIKNTGKTELRFVVWKWNNKGVDVPADPQADEK